MLRIGWFSTARGPTSRALLAAVWQAIEAGRLDAEIAYVFCSREPGESPETDQFLAQVRSYGVPLLTLSFERWRAAAGATGMGLRRGEFAPWRQEYDRRVADLVAPFNADVALQAGYMLVWTPLLCQRVRAINLHPAEPGGPAGTWQQVIWTLIERRARTSGVYMHLVTPHLDQGPVLTFCRYRIDTPEFAAAWEQALREPLAHLKAHYGEDLPLFRLIRAAGVRREVPLIVATLQGLADGSLALPADPAAVTARDLTDVIEAQLAGEAPEPVR